MEKSLKIKFHKETEKEKRERKKKYRIYICIRICKIILLITIILFFAYYIIYLDILNIRNKRPLNQNENIGSASIIHAGSPGNLNQTVSNESILFDSTNHETINHDRFLSKKCILNDTISGYYGISISEWQHTIYWDKLYNENESQPIKFVIIEATHGANSVDLQFYNNWKNAKNTNVNIGACHFFVLGDNPQQQAENYIRHVKLRKGNIYPIIRIGVNYSGLMNQEIDKVELIKRLTIFLNRLKEQYGVKPVVYTCYQFYDDYFRDELIGLKYMIAHYNNIPHIGMLSRVTAKTQLAPFVLIWQFSYKERLNGITSTTRMNFIPKEKLDLILLK